VSPHHQDGDAVNVANDSPALEHRVSLSNDELAAAIKSTNDMLRETTRMEVSYCMLEKHLRDLMEAQRSRARG
jgi:hypothetical protein